MREEGFRSNGFSLVRYILENIFGKDVYHKKSLFDKTWGEILLEPSTIYSAKLLKVLGRFGEKRKVEIKGISHITGGGIAGNFKRILKEKKIGAIFDNLFEPSEMVKEIQKLGNVSEEEAYKIWNMGNGMMLVVDPNNVDSVLQNLDVEAKVAGEITEEQKIIIQTKGNAPQKLIYKNH